MVSGRTRRDQDDELNELTWTQPGAALLTGERPEWFASELQHERTVAYAPAPVQVGGEPTPNKFCDGTTHRALMLQLASRKRTKELTMNAWNAVVGAVQMSAGAAVAWSYWKSQRNQRAWRAEKDQS